MPSANVETVSDTIGSIYDAAYDAATWPSTIRKLRDLFDGSKACFARLGPELGPADCVATDTDQSFTRRYIEHTDQPNALVEAVATAPVGLVYHDHALIGRDVLRRSRFWNEWMAPQGMYGGIACKLVVSGSSFWFFDVQRDRNQPAFDAADASLLRLLTPHLTRAARLGVHARQAQLSTLSQLALGLMHVDAGMRIVSMTEEADALIARVQGVLAIRAGTLWAAEGEAYAALRQYVTDACGGHGGIAPGVGGDVLIRSRDPQQPGVMLSVGPLTTTLSDGSPLRPCAVVVMREVALRPSRDFESHLRRLFDLSPGEARLAAALASGRSLKEAVSSQGIRINTGRFYLHNIFRKTETRQQSQLVALLKSTEPLLRRA